MSGPGGEPPVQQVVRALRWAADRVRSELTRLLLAARDGVGCGRRPWLALVATVLTVLAAAADRGGTARTVVRLIGGVRAVQPWWQECLRLPGSVFLPTPELPLVAAAGQLLVVVGVAELVLGQVATGVVAVLGQFVSSLAARGMMLAASVAVIGLPAAQAGVLDTGPSGVTTALGTFLLLRLRAYGCAVILAAVLLALCWAQNDLDSREHAVAVLCGAGAAGATRLTERLLAARRRSPALSAAGG